MTHSHGIWLCADPQTDATLPFEALKSSGRWPAQRRAKLAHDDPDRAFIWWMEARRAERRPEAARLRQRVQELFELAWPQRWNRVKSLAGVEVLRQGETWFDSNGHAGALLYGPYAPLPPGRHRLAVSLLLPDGMPADNAGAVDVVAGNECRVLAIRALDRSAVRTDGPFTCALEFELPATTFAVQIRVFAAEGVRLLARKAVTVEQAASVADMT
ncbi:hypothetical protein E4K72_14890 [Oxalobacteraceae bacterium OM1]|nr:hypothetical protein E4K72_14890 [Oxalobacteraceae bacterium OM1]